LVIAVISPNNYSERIRSLDGIPLSIDTHVLIRYTSSSKKNRKKEHMLFLTLRRVRGKR